MGSAGNATHREPWNKGKVVGQKAPFKPKDIWALRVRLQMEGRVRELALFNLGIDSKPRGCDLAALRVRDVCHGDQVASRAIVMQHKTQRPVQFEITQTTRDALQVWIRQATLKPGDFLFRAGSTPHPISEPVSTPGSLGRWVDELGVDRADYGTHSMRRTKATLIYLTQIISYDAYNKAEAFLTQPTLGNATRLMLCEETVAVAARGSSPIEALTVDETRALLGSEATRNMPPALRDRQLQTALDALPGWQAQLEAIAKARAQQLLQDHRRVREAAEAKGSYQVAASLPVDVMGVYVLAPAPAE